MDAKLETQITRVLAAFEAAAIRAYGRVVPNEETDKRRMRNRNPSATGKKPQSKRDACLAYLRANPGKTTHEVAAAIGCHHDTVGKYMRAIGYRSPLRRFWGRSKAVIIKGIADNPGMSARELSRILGVAVSYVNQIMRELKRASTE